jgi:hypothetical protein
VNDFPKAGEICGNCKEHWEEERKKPLKLLKLPTVTQIYHSEVAFCSYCDGPLRDIAIAALKREKDAS